MLSKKIKSIVKQYLLRKKFSRNNIIRKGVIFSKDLEIGKGCLIGKDSIIGSEVIIKDNVRIGRNTFLQKITINDNSTIELGVICTGYGRGRIIIGNKEPLPPLMVINI